MFSWSIPKLGDGINVRFHNVYGVQYSITRLMLKIEINYLSFHADPSTIVVSQALLLKVILYC